MRTPVFPPVYLGLMALCFCSNYSLADKLENPGSAGRDGPGVINPGPGCFTSSSGVASGTTVNYLFKTPATYTGNILAAADGCTPRSSADKLCQNARPGYTFPDNQCSNVRAFISLSSADSIANMPTNYGIPVGKGIFSVAGGEIDTSWTNMMAQPNTNDLQSVGVLPTSSAWWSFAQNTANGLFDTGANCAGGTTTAGTGRQGASSVNNTAWMSDTAPACTTSLYLLCICF
jgi:hypothetical protein